MTREARGRLHRNRIPQEYAVDLTIGRKIKDARMERGWLQADLAEKIGITNQQVSHYETASHRLSASRLVTIGKVLGYPPEWFMEQRDA